VQMTPDNGIKTYSRLFFALWPDEATRQALTQLSKTFDTQAGKPAAPDNFHVTLVFLGNVNLETAALLKQYAPDISAEPFELTFESLSYWQQPKILCATCKNIPQPIVALASKLDALARQCGLRTDIRSYVPHITLVRHAQFIPDQAIKPVVWSAEAFCLVQSCSEPEGVCYRVLRRWPLRLEKTS